MIMKRVLWIDFLRGLCMIAIMFFHTDTYFTGDNALIGYSFYVENAICIFFFISGYLFYGKTDYRHKLCSIAKGLLLPYFIFTLLLAVPKAVVHGYAITDVLFSIITGRTSWFVSALIVAELLFLGVLKLSRGHEWVMAFLSALSFSVCVIFIDKSNNISTLVNLWNIDNALLALPLVYIGWTFHKHEAIIGRVSNGFLACVLSLIAVCLKAYEHANGLQMLVEPIQVDNWLVFVLDIAAVTWLMVVLSKGVLSLTGKWSKKGGQNIIFRTIEWTGSHTLVYYFLCSAVPLAVSVLLNHCGIVFHDDVLSVLFAFILAYFATSAIVWTVYRFFPFMVGKYSSGIK